MREILSKYIKFSKEEYELFISKSKMIHFKKNEHLLLANESVNKIFFIIKGLVRGYRLINGIDITHHFFRENWFATDYESYLTCKTGELYLQALTDSSVYAFDKSILFSFYKENIKFEKIRVIQAEHAYLQTVERLKDLQTNDLKERYVNLTQQNPDLFNVVPQRYIASYLGATPQSLSRIKNLPP